MIIALRIVRFIMNVASMVCCVQCWSVKGLLCLVFQGLFCLLCLVFVMSNVHVMFSVCYVLGLLFLGSIISRVYYFQCLLCLVFVISSFVMSSVYYVWCLLSLVFGMSNVCYVQHLLCKESASSRVFYVYCLLCLIFM